MIEEPLKFSKDLPVEVDRVVDFVIDENDRNHTVSVGYAYQRYRGECLVLSIDCFTVDPKHIAAIPSLDEQIRNIISERLGKTEFQHDKIIMI